MPKLKPGSEIRDRKPLISAVVTDAETELTQGNITLMVDGGVKPFAYDTVSDNLVRQSGKLAFGKHTVSVTATDGQASTTKAWSFKVVRRLRNCLISKFLPGPRPHSPGSYFIHRYQGDAAVSQW